MGESTKEEEEGVEGKVAVNHVEKQVFHYNVVFYDVW